MLQMKVHVGRSEDQEALKRFCKRNRIDLVKTESVTWYLIFPSRKIMKLMRYLQKNDIRFFEFMLAE